MHGVQTGMISGVKLISGHSLGGPNVTPCQFELHLSTSFYPHASLHHQRLRNCHNFQQNQLIKREPKVSGSKYPFFLKGTKIATFWNIRVKSAFKPMKYDDMFWFLKMMCFYMNQNVVLLNLPLLHVWNYLFYYSNLTFT